MNREERERRIFQLFVEAAHLPVIPGSVWSAPPPAPDILCEIQSKGSVSFELVEIVTPAFAKGLENSRRMEQAFRGICERYPEIAVRFSDAFIYVGFLEHTTIRQRLTVVHKVVCELGQHSENSWGQIEVPARLERIVSEISVTRGCSYGPVFSVLEMSEHHDEIYIQIEKKCKKKYSTDYSIELLAHYTSQPSREGFDWQSKFHAYILDLLPRCPFERVWVYDNWSKEIKYVFPSLAIGRET